MSDISDLITRIEDSIYENGVQAITGEVMQDTLTDVVETIDSVKQDAESGKGLSTNDFTDELLARLEALEGVYVATVGTTALADIAEAADEGQVVIAVEDGFIYYLVYYSDTDGLAVLVSQTSSGIMYYEVDSDGWQSGQNDIELTANKVTSLSASSTDTEYPSAKAVYDLIASVVSDLGDLSDLDTTDQSSAVAAINEVVAGLATKQDTLTIDSALDSSSENPVQNKVVKAAIDDVASDVSQLGLEVGDLTDLDTTDQTSVVAAINEVKGDADTVASNLGYEETYKALSLFGVEDTITGVHINMTNNVWASATTADSFFLAIKPGRKYFIRAFGTSASRVAVLTTNTYTVGSTPSYATGFSAMVSIPAGTDYTFTAPEDAAYLNVNYTLASVLIVPSFIMEQQTESEAVEALKILEYDHEGMIKRYVDARIASDTFGMTLKATNTDWYAGDPILCRGYKKIRYNATLFSTSSNYYGKAGDMFLDENFDPITTDGVYLIQYGGSALTAVTEIDIPDGAWYFRHTFTTTTLSAGTTIELISEAAEGGVAYAVDKADKTYSYYGAKIDLGNSYDYAAFARNGIAGQSAAVYGDYLFIVTDLLAKVACYNLKTRSLLYTLTTGITSQSYWHCNQSSFSPNFYDADDPFPVLYISMQNNGDARGEAHGYRIIPTYTDDEISSFEISLVQTVYLPAMTDDNCLGNPNVTFDTKGGYMWAYGRNENSEADNYRLAHFARFAIPDPTAGDITLEDSDILDDFADDWSMLYAQGGFIRNGKLVIMQGYQSAGYIYCRVIDLYLTQKQESLIDLLADGFTLEPEGVFYWDGHIMCTANTTSMYKFDV